jgi:hypothetical protein
LILINSDSMQCRLTRQQSRPLNLLPTPPPTCLPPYLLMTATDVREVEYKLMAEQRIYS